MAAKCTPVLRIPAVRVSVPNKTQIMHKRSIGRSGEVCETFLLSVRNVLRTSLIEASKLLFYLSPVLRNSSSEERGMCKDFCYSKKIYDRKEKPLYKESNSN